LIALWLILCVSENASLSKLIGATHSTQDERQRDKDREDFLLTQGFRVVRFSNEDVLQNWDGVMDTIVHALNMPPHPIPSPQGGGVKLEPTRQ
jgi:very-short-patch-repair endonuclease